MRAPSASVRREELDLGFTLIELLVVVVIIGILAAVAIPAFLAQREGSYAATVKSDIRNAAQAVETFALNNSGGYAGVDVSALESYGFNESDDVDVEVVPTGDTYEIVAVSTAFSPAREWRYSSATGTITN